MVIQKNLFDTIANTIIETLTYVINIGSGILQISVYFLLGITFIFALIKAYKTFRVLAYCDIDKILKNKKFNDFQTDTRTPLAFIAASFFVKVKNHYLREKDREEVGNKVIPPDDFIRDAAFQFTERYFEGKFLEPIAMMANLLPPLGFIGTIIGMVIHFLSNGGTIRTDITIVGIATALYTTFIGLICYTILEFFKKIFCSLAQKRIDEGLTAVSLRETYLSKLKSR